MQSSLENMAPGYGSLLMWGIIIIVALLALWFIIKLLRRLSFGTFIAGGKNRKMRLAIMDATPVDNHRRLVLIRRDDVEHLILIGGPNDLIVEQNIRPQSQQNRPMREPVRENESQRRAEPVVAPPVSRPTPPVQTQAVEPIASPIPPRQMEAPRPVATPQQSNTPASAPVVSAPEVRVETPRPSQTSPVTQRSEPVVSPVAEQNKLDQEMEKFLDDLAQSDLDKRI